MKFNQDFIQNLAYFKRLLIHNLEKTDIFFINIVIKIVF